MGTKAISLERKLKKLGYKVYNHLEHSLKIKGFCDKETLKVLAQCSLIICISYLNLTKVEQVKKEIDYLKKDSILMINEDEIRKGWENE